MLSDISIDAILGEYRHFCKQNKLVIMHRIYTQSRDPQHTEMIFYNKKNMNLVYCKLLGKHRANPKHQLTLKEHSRFKWKWLFEEDANFELVTGVGYSGLSICKPVVLNYFNENFDYHCENSDFLTSLLNSEIASDHVSFSILPSSVFCQSIGSWDGLVAAVVKLLQQASVNFNINKQAFRFESCSRVISNQSFVSPRVRSLQNCFIGARANVAENVLLESSVLIDSCRIGKNAELRNCYLSKGVQIGENMTLVNCVILSPNTSINKEYLANSQIDYDSENDRIFVRDLLIRKDGESTEINVEPPAPLRDDESYNLESESEEEEQDNYFETEARDVLNSVDDDFQNIDQVLTDIISLRLSQNKSFQDTLIEILIFIWSRLFKVKDNRVGIFSLSARREPLSTEEFMNQVKKLQHFADLLEKFTVSRDEEMFILNFIQGTCRDFPDLLISTLTQMMFKLGILNREVILEWYRQVQGLEIKSEFEEKVLVDLGQFAGYLEEVNDESESESESESDSGSENEEEDDAKSGTEDSQD